MFKKGCDNMSTFMFKNKNSKYTLVSNVFIDKYMPKARGEFVKVYILGLKYCMSGEIGVSSSILASTLHILETDIINAWNYWKDEGVIKMLPIDSMGNFHIEFLDLSDINEPDNDVSLVHELSKDSTKDMLQDIEKLLGRPLSSKEISLYLSWQKDFNFTPEIILLLMQYAASKGKTDHRYIETIAIAWFDANIKTVEDAQSFIKKHEDKWIRLRKILEYLGIKNGEIMKPQEQMLEKWINTYNFSNDIIFKACDICFERLNRCEFKYIDGILNSWFKDNIKSLEDIALKDNKRVTFKKNAVSNSKSKFNNYEQRTYNIEEIERKLLGWDNND